MAHDPRTIGLIVGHHSASNPFKTTWRTIQRWHWPRFQMVSGYHRIIERDGFVMDGQRIQKRGAHAPPNANRFGILVVGWNEENHDLLSKYAVKAGWEPSWEWTEAQWDALDRELDYDLDRMPGSMVCGHRQTKATLCPGLDLRAALIARGFPQPDRLVEGRLF